MCGIAGIWGSADEPLVRAMVDRLRHRGPDASGLHGTERGTLGHARLSIMDPAGGDQPLYDEDRSHAIVANGELYNYPELRRRLGVGHRFRTRSDSEAAVHLYEEMTERMCRQLDGMFALAIDDAGEGLFLARDPIGIKPLYYGSRNGDLVFASELKALDGQARDVEEFPPGSYYHTSSGLRTYYRVPRRAPRPLALEPAIRIVRATLEEAVGKRLMSDVPVGAFLSGGLDSSLIAALARQHVDELHTFSVGVEGSPDLEAARRVAGHLGTRHHEYTFGPEEVVEALPRIVYHLESYDRDLVRSAIPCHFVSRLAADHVKVILTGEGADELFAGYRYYRDVGSGDLHRELCRSVASLHNINLQRVDRLTMAHGIEGRVPFLDLEMIDAALTLPVEMKLRNVGDRLVEKWILRKACEDLLPPEILWRDKEQFDEGSGTLEMLPGLLDRWLAPERAGPYARAHGAARLRSREECVYHRLLADEFRDMTTVVSNIGRWSLPEGSGTAPVEPTPTP